MPEKFKRCVEKVKARGGANPYAVCTATLGVPADRRKKKGKGGKK